MTVEQYLNYSDPYRTISTPSPLPLPLKLEPALHLGELIRTLSDGTGKVLQLHGVPPTASVETTKAAKPLYPKEGPINLLLVVFTASNQTPPNLDLDPVKDDLLHLLRRHGLHDVHVEIINVDLCHCFAMGYLPSTDPVNVAFEKVKRQIVEILEQTISDGWHVLV